MGWPAFLTTIAFVGVDLQISLGEVKVGFGDDLVQGKFSAADDFAGAAVAEDWDIRMGVISGCELRLERTLRDVSPRQNSPCRSSGISTVQVSSPQWHFPLYSGMVMILR